MHWNAQNHIWKPQSNNIIIMFMIFVFCFSPICFLYLKYLFGLSHFSFSICNHLTLCARWCFILHWYSCVLVWWSFFSFVFFIHLQLHLSFLPIQSKVARIFKYTRSTTQSRTYSAFFFCFVYIFSTNFNSYQQFRVFFFRFVSHALSSFICISNELTNTEKINSNVKHKRFWYSFYIRICHQPLLVRMLAPCIRVIFYILFHLISLKKL